MTSVIGVRFKKNCKIYFFDPKGIEFEQGDGAIVETANGVEYGEVVACNKEIEEDKIVAPLKPVIRKATDKDKRNLQENKDKEAAALQTCKEKIEEHKLDMKLIGVEIAFDGSKMVFFFTADGRVDFRGLVKDLASVFKTRIELRQVGVRDETKMLGGLGPCGRPCCCSAFLGEFQPVSIKMAKEQNLSLSPTKISGLCGRLMCCLNYEQKYYEEMRSVMPRGGNEVKTPDGEGVVIDSNPLKQTVRVKVSLGDDEFDVRTYALEDVERSRRPRKPQNKERPQKSSKQGNENPKPEKG